jgi:hypothetical protein
MLLQPLETEMPPSTFASSVEAKDALDKLMHGILLLSQRVQKVLEGREGVPSSMIEAQHTAMARLRTWRETYTTTDKVQLLPARDIQAYTLLLNYYTMATVMCETLFSATETVYDVHTARFVSIVNRTTELWTRK